MGYFYMCGNSQEPKRHRVAPLGKLLARWPRSEQVALFNEATKAEPYFYGTYFSFATSLLPRWGGSLTDYDQFVETAVEKTRAVDGETMYARLYWALSRGEWDKDPFKDLHIRWKSMRAGFDDLMKRYPKSQWNLHHYAYFACRAHDGKSFDRLWPNLDVQQMRLMPTIWFQPYTLDNCIDQFGGPDKHHPVESGKSGQERPVEGTSSSDAGEATRCSTHPARLDEANIRRCTEKLASLGPSVEERVITFNTRGNNYDALKRYDLAIADYTEVIQLQPDAEYGYASRALEQFRKEDFPAAVADYDQALRVNPKSSYALYGRGVARLKSGDAAGGEADIAMANQQDPKIANICRSLGVVP